MRTVAIPMESLAEVIKLQLSDGDRAPLTVTGGSMLPMLRDRRDKVMLCSVTGPLRKGALPLYRRQDGTYVLHRVVRVVSEDRYLCCGDNQWKTEEIAAGQIIALVTEFTRKGKQYSVADLRYRLYVWLWVGILPVRRPLLAVRRWLGHLRRKQRNCKKNA